MNKINLPTDELLAGLAEECAELSQAALKLRRVYTQINPTPIKEEQAEDDFYEEIADVLLYLEQIGYPKEYVETVMNTKRERWSKRMEGRKEA